MRNGSRITTREIAWNLSMLNGLENIADNLSPRVTGSSKERQLVADDELPRMDNLS
jgi:hypothetical protein